MAYRTLRTALYTFVMKVGKILQRIRGWPEACTSSAIDCAV